MIKQRVDILVPDQPFSQPSEELKTPPKPHSSIHTPSPLQCLSPNSTCNPQLVPSFPSYISLDFSLQKPTASCLPATAAIASAFALPFGFSYQPFCPKVQLPPPTSSDFMIRCKKCQSYMNCFNTFIDNGSYWRCCMCGTKNHTPPHYFCPLSCGIRTDISEHPELVSNNYDIIPTKEFIIKALDDPVFAFCLDVTSASFSTKYLQSSIQAIRVSLKQLYRLFDDKFSVLFACFDSKIHFFRFVAGAAFCCSLPEIDEPYVPFPHGLIVNYEQNIANIEKLLSCIPDLFRANLHLTISPSAQVPTPKPGILRIKEEVQRKLPSLRFLKKSSSTPTKGDSIPQTHPASRALGSCITSVINIFKERHGCVVYFSAGTGTAGQMDVSSSLSTRKNNGKLTEKISSKLFCSESPVFDTISKQAGEKGIGICGFFASSSTSSYLDLASYSVLSNCTGGICEFFPDFQVHRDSDRLVSLVSSYLGSIWGLNCSFKVRSSKGLSISKLYGNYHRVASSDRQYNVPICSQSWSSAIVMNVEKDLTKRSDHMGSKIQGFIQSSMIFSDNFNSRIVRVVTTPCYISKSCIDVCDSIDVDSQICLQCKILAEAVKKEKLVSIRKKLVKSLQSCLSMYKANSGSHRFPISLQELPILFLSLLKQPFLCLEPSIPLDMRTVCMNEFLSSSSLRTRSILFPRVLSIDPTEKDLRSYSHLWGKHEYEMRQENLDLWRDGLLVTDVKDSEGQLPFYPEIRDILLPTLDDDKEITTIPTFVESVPPSIRSFSSKGIFIIESRFALFIFLMPDVTNQILEELFGKGTSELFSPVNLSRFDTIQASLHVRSDTVLGRVVLRVIASIRAERECMIPMFIVHARSGVAVLPRKVLFQDEVWGESYETFYATLMEEVTKQARDKRL
ncbi:hypothetical protein ADUPG1_007965 [Aduncisulcus paluster]|uniref:Uncharacterized protein n=1 Tax=Aduncisulcus paluster TaxID=2918883 RepID=A0ABQ5KQ90_9EUKA|nr:hypothetical protein ADUPG1_007965 [Aduncisulcus paluster]